MVRDKICVYCGEPMSYEDWRDSTFKPNEYMWKRKKYCSTVCCGKDHRKQRRVKMSDYVFYCKVCETETGFKMLPPDMQRFPKNYTTVECVECGWRWWTKK